MDEATSNQTSRPASPTDIPDATEKPNERKPEASSNPKAQSFRALCVLHAVGKCTMGAECEYVHGEVCSQCGLAQLHPEDCCQRREHQRDCMKDPDQEKKVATAVAASQDMACGICMEKVVYNDITSECGCSRKFGLLENCDHSFCLRCITKWRNSNNGSLQMQRTCPICRTESNFVTPNRYWVKSSEEKTQLLDKYKKTLKSQHCDLFKRGQGFCPSGSRCLYLHALPDGTEVVGNVVDPWGSQIRRQQGSETGSRGAQPSPLPAELTWPQVMENLELLYAHFLSVVATHGNQSGGGSEGFEEEFNAAEEEYRGRVAEALHFVFMRPRSSS